MPRDVFTASIRPQPLHSPAISNSHVLDMSAQRLQRFVLVPEEVDVLVSSKLVRKLIDENIRP